VDDFHAFGWLRSIRELATIFEPPLFQGIAHHRVAWVQKADRLDSLKGSEQATIVTKSFCDAGSACDR